jgi:hypothetical protein
VHLAAAGLLHRELDGVTQTFEHTRDGDSGLREQRVVIAGDKERDTQRIPPEVYLMSEK